MATLDTTTAGEYSALYNASDRASLIVSALSGTVTVNVYDGTDTVVGTGTMASPWATAVDDTVVIGSVNGFAVTSTGTPDDNWYLRFVSGSRYVQFTFGLLGSGKEAVWSRSDWTAGTQAGIRNSVITVSGNVPPVFSVAPTSASIGSSGGTIKFTATDANDDTLTYSLANKYLSSITINSSTGLVTVPASAAGTSGNITVRASDGTLTTDATCAVTVAASSETRNVFAEATFDLGFVSVQPTAINQTDSSGRLLRLNSGLYMGATPKTQSAFEAYVTGSAYPSAPVYQWGTNSEVDTHVVASEVITEGGFNETCTPRAGTHFLRSKLYRAKDTSYTGGVDYASPGTGVYPTKHYENCLNNSGITAHDDALCNPRSAFYFFNRTVYGINWDQDYWFGFSVRVPLNYEDETVGVGQTYNGPMLLSINPNDPQRSHLTLNAIVPNSNWTRTAEATAGATKTHWCIQWYLNNAGVNETNVTRISLGEVVKGKWTDFVFNIRWNPFTTAQTANGVSFAGGSVGKIRVWQGIANANGTRTITESSPSYSHSGPCGLLPGTEATKNQILMQPRVYMFGWKPTFATSRTHPVWLGFDQFRLGFAAGSKVVYQNGAAAGFNDVAPGVP